MFYRVFYKSSCDENETIVDRIDGMNKNRTIDFQLSVCSVYLRKMFFLFSLWISNVRGVLRIERDESINFNRFLNTDDSRKGLVCDEAGTEFRNLLIFNV